MKKTSYHLGELIENYLKHLKFNQSASVLTLKAYKKDLTQFFEDSKKEKANTSFSPPTFSTQTKKESTLWIKQKLRHSFTHWSRWSPATKNRKIASLKSFFKWLYQERYLTEDLNQKLKTPKIPIKLPRYLSVDEVMHLIQVIHQQYQKNPQILSELVLVLLLYGGGLRVSEACHIQWIDLDFSHHTLRVKGKGSKERLIVLPVTTFQYLKILKTQTQTQFIFGQTPLGPRKAFAIIKQWGIKANLQQPISPHVLRHSYATHLLESGSDLRVIQDLLGHQSLAATQKYTQVQLSKLAKTLNTYHPLSKNTYKK